MYLMKDGNLCAGVILMVLFSRLSVPINGEMPLQKATAGIIHGVFFRILKDWSG